MPIKSLVERMRLPRLGVIRLGVKETNARGVSYPKEVPHFVVPDDLRGVLEPHPTRIPVLFPSDDPERVLAADYIRYQGKLLTLKCDGETFREIAPTGQETVGPCRKAPREKCPCGAEAKARLNVIVLDGPLGIYQVLIGGEQRIADLLSELHVFRQTLGRLTEILFYLERVPTEIQVKKEDGSRLARTGWPVHIRCDFTAKQALRARGLQVLGHADAVAALPAAVEEHEDEAVPDEPEETHTPEILPARADSSNARADGGGLSPERPANPQIPLRAGPSGGSEQHPSREPVGETQRHRPPHHPDASPEEWTIETVAARAQYLGVAPGTLSTFCEARFGKSLDLIGAPELAHLGHAMTVAEADGKPGMAKWKLHVLEVCKAAGAAKRKAALGVGR